MEFNNLEIIDKIETKVCKTCGIPKPISEFYFSKYGKPYTNCKVCNNAITRKWIDENPESRKQSDERKRIKIQTDEEYRKRNNASKKKYLDKNPDKRIYHMTKSRAIKNGIPFDITLEDIVIPEYCPILNIKLAHGIDTLCDTSPSIDKVDPSKGYVKGNVRIISLLANKMKNSATTEQLLLFCKNLPKYLNIDDIV